MLHTWNEHNFKCQLYLNFKKPLLPHFSDNNHREPAAGLEPLNHPGLVPLLLCKKTISPFLLQHLLILFRSQPMALLLNLLGRVEARCWSSLHSTGGNLPTRLLLGPHPVPFLPLGQKKPSFLFLLIFFVLESPSLDIFTATRDFFPLLFSWSVSIYVILWKCILLDNI